MSFLGFAARGKKIMAAIRAAIDLEDPKTNASGEST